MKMDYLLFFKMMNKLLVWSFCMIVLSSCVVSPPKKTSNICEIFYEKRSWYKAAVKTEKRWGSPAYVTLAFIKQESDFQQGAKPERTKLFGFIPWKRKSSAYGYAQAIDGTWDIYKKQAKKPFASRTSFKDSVDFVGWYNKKSNKLLGIPKDNARLLYLAYHEGRGGYKKGSYKSKPWLLSVSSDVQKMSNRYRNQYDSCKKKLKSPFYFLFN